MPRRSTTLRTYAGDTSLPGGKTDPEDATVEDTAPILNDAEVTSLFSHPLASFLTTKPPFPAEPELLEVPYHTYNDWTSPGPNDTLWTSRAHRFLTGREAGGIKPVFGLTASIMIRVSTIAYGHPPEFDVHPPELEVPELKVRLAWTMLSKPEFREACEREGLQVDWERLRRIAGVERESDGTKIGKQKVNRRRVKSKL
ncbi:hypothetical protein H0H92_012155 [Tricholoma furcatifolium]|nr:hypothetical protein H0H92_012155 [Tricholoma furcatifolium]